MKKIIMLPLIGLVFTVSACNFSSGTSPESQTIYKMNENVESNGWVFCVTSVVDTKKISSYAEADSNYIVVKINITNKQSSSQVIGSSDFTLYQGNTSYDIDSVAELAVENNVWGGETISSNETYAANLVFETPTKHTENNYELAVGANKRIALYGTDNGGDEKSGPSLGDKQTLNDFEIQVNEVKFTTDIADANNGGKPNSGMKWCVVKFSVKNNGTSKKSLADEYYTQLFYDSNYSYLSKYLYYNEFFEAHQSIEALQTLEVCSNFEVPEEVETNTNKKLEFKFSKNKINTTEFVMWTLR